MDDDGPLCRCGHIGCLETFVSVPAIETALASGADREHVLRAAGARLGVAIAATVAIMNINEIVLAGPKALLDETFSDAALESLRRNCLQTVADSVRLGHTALGDDVVMLGASSLVLSRELGVA